MIGVKMKSRLQMASIGEKGPLFKTTFHKQRGEKGHVMVQPLQERRSLIGFCRLIKRLHATRSSDDAPKRHQKIRALKMISFLLK